MLRIGDPNAVGGFAKPDQLLHVTSESRLGISKNTKPGSSGPAYVVSAHPPFSGHRKLSGGADATGSRGLYL